jgi:hypothetical protein
VKVAALFILIFAKKASQCLRFSYLLLIDFLQKNLKLKAIRKETKEKFL